MNGSSFCSSPLTNQLTPYYRFTLSFSVKFLSACAKALGLTFLWAGPSQNSHPFVCLCLERMLQLTRLEGFAEQLVAAGRAEKNFTVKVMALVTVVNPSRFSCGDPLPFKANTAVFSPIRLAGHIN